MATNTTSLLSVAVWHYQSVLSAIVSSTQQLVQWHDIALAQGTVGGLNIHAIQSKPQRYQNNVQLLYCRSVVVVMSCCVDDWIAWTFQHNICTCARPGLHRILLRTLFSHVHYSLEMMQPVHAMLQCWICKFEINWAAVVFLHVNWLLFNMANAVRLEHGAEIKKNSR